MSSDPARTTRALGELARAQLPGAVSVEAERRGLERLRSRLGARSKARGPWLMVGLACAGAAALALVIALPALRLSFVVEGGASSAEGYVTAVAERPALVKFSDGTEVALEGGGRGRVADVGLRGARVVVEDGRARVHVRKRSRGRWSFEAGPYVVVVTGTAFAMDWSPRLERFSLELSEGSVLVRGPGAGAEVAVVAGQRLIASPSTGELRIEAVRAPVITAPAPEEPPAATPPDRRAPARVGPSPRASEVDGWARRIAAGDHQGVLAEARRRGLPTLLARGTSEELAALADAARYAGDHALAKRSLLAQRRRFGGSVLARDAAFFLGRLAQDRDHDPASAGAWYDRYLAESAGTGAFAAEALGRRMVVQHELGRDDAACASGRAYLAREPAGPYARLARELCR